MALSFDAVVVGAGPAGLSAGAELSARGTCLLLEQGPLAPARSRNVDLLSGVGGAGLFSDGKHSFFPSATGLWTLPHRDALARAYAHTVALLQRFGVRGEPLPPSSEAPEAQPGWAAKPYPSEYVSLEGRLACIEALWSATPEKWSDAKVVGAGRAGQEIVLEVEHHRERVELRTRRLVVATGRWSPRWTRAWLEALGARFVFRRIEFGVRLETNASADIFRVLPGVDGKLIWNNPAFPFQARTFCTCREGEVVLGEAHGLCGYSGRADGPRTTRSNFGLLVRTEDERVGREVEGHLFSARPRVTPLSAFRAADFGASGARMITLALERLLEFHPALARGEVTVYSPCIEGVGDYAVHDDALSIAPGVQVAGDMTGRFRGIVAGMVSGRYCALT